MKNSFTLHDFFLLYHNETDERNESFLENSFLSAFKDEDEFTGLSDQSSISVETLIAPDKKIIDNLMGYARALYLVKTDYAGDFHIVMN